MADGDGASLEDIISNMFDWPPSTSVSNLTSEQAHQLCSIVNKGTSVLPHLELNATLSDRPSTIVVWTLGLSVVTLINMCAVVGIGVMRYLSKSVYNQVITFMVGLGVGSLSGSSLYHLLPQAHPILLMDANGEPSHDYLIMAHFAIIGVYTFFFADKLIKIVLQWRKKGLHASDRADKWRHSNDMGDAALLHDHLNHKGNGDSSDIEAIGMKDSSCKSMGDQAHGMCSHEHQVDFGAGKSAIAAVAWMILFGDGLHNLIDGISIGASFAESTRSGLSVSIAVLAEEFPHELGDVAILVASGLTLRQALLYNLLSALTCYIGFGIGVVIGDLGPENAKYLFALAGGMFLYISLSCMMPEMKNAMEEALNVSIKKGLYVFFLQALGLFSGLFLMFGMARWGDLINIDHCFDWMFGSQ